MGLSADGEIMVLRRDSRGLYILASCLPRR